MIKTYSALLIGDAKLTIHRNHERLTVWYYSNEAFSRDENNEIVGYTDLKAKKRRHRQIAAVLKISDSWTVEVYEEKTAHKAVKGYIQIGDNQFIAIEKSSHIWLLFLLLALGIFLLCFSFCGRSDVPTDTSVSKPWVPTIDQHIDEFSTGSTQTAQQIKIAGFSKWHIPAGETDDLPISLKNPEGNPCYFSFAITLTDTDETIYQSDMVPPGSSLHQITIQRPLPEGTYQAVLHISTNDLTTGRAMNGAKLNLTITVD